MVTNTTIAFYFFSSNVWVELKTSKQTNKEKEKDMSKMNHREILERIFQWLTGVDLKSLPSSLFYVGLVAGLPNRKDLDQSCWHGLKAELSSTFEGVTNLMVFLIPRKDFPNQKEFLLDFTASLDTVSFSVSRGRCLILEHWKTVFCAEVMLFAHRLANGLDEAPAQPTQRDEQVVRELANSAQRPDPVPNFAELRTC